MDRPFRVENLVVYTKLCDLYIEVCELTRTRPFEERFELSSQVRRSSNGAPANLAEKHNDRHVRNRIEGVNRCRGEAFETVHHLYVAQRRGHLTTKIYESLRKRYEECIRMLNGLERNYEKQLPPEAREWPPSAKSSSRKDDLSNL